MRIPSAMGRSNRPPSLGRSAGARFTVIRPAGNSKRELRSAARTRSLLSFTTVAGRPTIQNVQAVLLLGHNPVPEEKEMSRITEKQLQALVDRINELTGSPL